MIVWRYFYQISCREIYFETLLWMYRDIYLDLLYEKNDMLYLVLEQFVLGWPEGTGLIMFLLHVYFVEI